MCSLGVVAKLYIILWAFGDLCICFLNNSIICKVYHSLRTKAGKIGHSFSIELDKNTAGWLHNVVFLSS